MSPGNVVRPSSNVAVTCTLDYSRLGHNDVIWQVKRGSLVNRIGYNFNLEIRSFTVDDDRYSLSYETRGSATTYTLNIRGECVCVCAVI